LNNTNFEGERGRRRRRGSNKEKLELGTRYADVVVANQRTIPTKGVFPESESAAERVASYYNGNGGVLLEFGDGD
jgi:hypothetical protein